MPNYTGKGYFVKGRHPSDETREKLSKSLKGRISWSKGLKAKDDKRVKNFVEAGHKATKGKPSWNKGRKETRPEVLKRIGDCKRGKKQSVETRLKRSKSQSGEKHYNWQGGKSFELYGFEWTKLLKHSIRTRDCFTCYICKKNGWVVHHIDYNKKNNNPDNLITLCQGCHAKTNQNRNYWIDYFKTL